MLWPAADPKPCRGLGARALVHGQVFASTGNVMDLPPLSSSECRHFDLPGMQPNHLFCCILIAAFSSITVRRQNPAKRKSPIEGPLTTTAESSGLTQGKVRSGSSLCGNKARFAALADSAWGEGALGS